MAVRLTDPKWPEVEAAVDRGRDRLAEFLKSFQRDFEHFRG